MSKRNQIANVPDVKTPEGIWLKSYAMGDSICHTRAGKLWNNINSRCTVGFQRRQTAYLGTSNGFKDFQEFAEWATLEAGYNELDSGRFWQIDKDLLVPGSKVYSPETCVFVPSVVNNFFKDGQKNGLKTGVSLYPYDRSRYLAFCGGAVGSEYLGIFETEEAAHQAYRSEKIRSLQCLMERFQNYPKILKALRVQEQLI